MVPNNINEFESNLLIHVYGNKKRQPRAYRIHKSLSFTVTYDGNIVLLDNGLCLWHNASKAWRAVVNRRLYHSFGNKLFE